MLDREIQKKLHLHWNPPWRILLTSDERFTSMEELAYPPSTAYKGTHAVHSILKRNLTYIQGSSLGLTIDNASI
jgi:hypothetical protein